MKIIRKMKVLNAFGLHTRPATSVVKLLQGHKSEVTFCHKKETVNAKSILNLLILAAKKNSLITVTIDGEDAEEVANKLEAAFENRFGEK